VQISSPWLDDGFRQGPIDIKGSAWSSSFSGYDLYYGIGDNRKNGHRSSPIKLSRSWMVF
jgi:hypothetical protein